jgi:putative ABC transport system substrate-binding protein
MRRREFITLIGGAAAWPLAARAQQPAMPVIGFLRNTTPEDSVHILAALRQGLKEAGYVEGQNVAVDYRFAENRYERLSDLAADLVRRQVAVIIAGGNASSLAAKAATTTIPVVFATGDDPVKIGLVASLNRPGGNVTGVSFFTTELGAKRVGLLRELIPTATTIAYLMNPNNPYGELEMQEARTAAHALGLQILVLRASAERDLDTAFATLVQQRAATLLVGADAFFLSRGDRLIALAARHAVPTMYFVRELAAAGGLMSYGTSQPDAYRAAGLYAGRILKGAKPADLPVILPTKYELAINLKTAKELGITVPYPLLARADEVIE